MVQKDEQAEYLYNFGLHIGIAFQIMDDYLDVFGKQEQFGKNMPEIFLKIKNYPIPYCIKICKRGGTQRTKLLVF